MSDDRADGSGRIHAGRLEVWMESDQQWVDLGKIMEPPQMTFNCPCAPVYPSRSRSDFDVDQAVHAGPQTWGDLFMDS